jgi:hypothetical protein
VYVLEADTAFGNHVLWVDCKNFLPRRVEVKRRITDLLYGESLSKRNLIEHVTVADSFVTEQVGDRLLPVAARMTRTMTSPGGEVREIVASHRRSAINLNPVFGADAFKLRAPDGTRAQVEGDNSGLEYEWRNGRVAPAMNPRVLASIDGPVKPLDPFPPPRSALRRTWTVLVSASVAAALGVGVVYVMRARKSRAAIR